MTVLAYILSGLSLLISVLILVRLRVNWFGVILWFPKLYAGALSAYGVVIGAAGAIVGGIGGAYGAVPMGLFGAGVSVWYVWRCSRDNTGLDDLFGVGWQDQIPSEAAGKMLKSRWTMFLKMGASPQSSFERDVVFRIIPGTQRELLCDLWRPGDGSASEVGVIYLHGSAWMIGDKDLFTRPFFRHLVSQGHTVMDVSYRLFPETDLFGMISDVKYAIAWMKENASRFGVDPNKIVLAGGSAGGHLALLAGYAPAHPELKPQDLKNTDLSVCGVISYYGPSDLLAMYQGQVLNLPEIEDQPPRLITTETTLSNQDIGLIHLLLGGRPQDNPEAYPLFSPKSHVHPGCPPTLLFHGEPDILVPSAPTKALYHKLVEAEVPASYVMFPKTDHGFDLILPQVNPAAQSALYDVDRFLAILANK